MQSLSLISDTVQGAGTPVLAAPGNTRLDSQKHLQGSPTLGLDWLDFRGVLKSEQVIDMFEWVADRCDDVVDWQKDRPGRGHVRLTSTVRTIRGAIFGWSEEEGMSNVWVSLNGAALAGAGSTMAQMFIASMLIGLGLRCTRLDIFLDDYTDYLARVRTDIFTAYRSGQHTGFRKLQRWEDYEDYKTDGSLTTYLGSRQSASFIRIYDKGDRTRWEREVKREVSDTIMRELVDVHEMARATTIESYDQILSSALKSHITNGIDFIDRKDKNLDRGVRVEFWANFLAWLDEIQVKVVRVNPKPLLENTMQWLDRQVAKSLALVKRVVGVNYTEWIGNLLKRGESRFNSRDEKIIDLHRAYIL